MAAVVKLEPQTVDVLTAMPAAGNDVAIKTEEAQQQTSSAQAAPSLISAVTQAAVGNATNGMQSILEDGHVFMPPLPADLQAELASSASSSFNGVATFGIMQQQLLSTFDGSPVLAGDFAADLFASPGFAVTASTDTVMTDGPGGVAPAAHDAAAAAAAASVAAVKAAVASNIGDTVPVMNTLAFNAAAGVSHCICPFCCKFACPYICICRRSLHSNCNCELGLASIMVAHKLHEPVFLGAPSNAM